VKAIWEWDRDCHMRDVKRDKWIIPCDLKEPHTPARPVPAMNAINLDSRPSNPNRAKAAPARYVFDDGGRGAAGYKGLTGDCVCRAIAIATGKPYQEVYDALNAMAANERTGKRKRGKSNARTGVYKPTIRKYMESIGWRWTPTMKIGQGTKVHLREDELPSGRLVVLVSKHMTAVIDGTIHDTHDCSRGGKRCVYGYYTK
jgi:hypothetical protein